MSGSHAETNVVSAELRTACTLPKAGRTELRSVWIGPSGARVLVAAVLMVQSGVRSAGNGGWNGPSSVSAVLNAGPNVPKASRLRRTHA